MLPTSAVTPLAPESCDGAGQTPLVLGRGFSGLPEGPELRLGSLCAMRTTAAFQQLNQYYAREAICTALWIPNLMQMLTVPSFLLLLTFGILPCNAGTQPSRQQQAQSARAQQDSAKSQAEEQDLDVTDQVIRDVLKPLQEGIEGRNPEQLLTIFDKAEMSDYAQLRDQITAFLRQHESIRFRYEVLQVASEGDHGSAVLNTDVAATPGDLAGIPVHRNRQLRLEMKRGPKGWRVVGLKPADFFTQ
jgi:hypothetical protein